MIKRILLIDNSVTVQKVVSLTLDRTRYDLSFCQSRSEVRQKLSEQLPDVILVSDQLKDLDPQTFPKEVESWVGQLQRIPAIILISKDGDSDWQQYDGVLHKPFTPAELESQVAMAVGTAPVQTQPTTTTLKEAAVSKPTNLWSPAGVKNTPKTYPKVSGEVPTSSVESQLVENLDQVVDRVLTRIVPPIVEKIVRERLDKLLKEQGA